MGEESTSTNSALAPGSVRGPVHSNSDCCKASCLNNKSRILRQNSPIREGVMKHLAAAFCVLVLVTRNGVNGFAPSRLTFTRINSTPQKAGVVMTAFSTGSDSLSSENSQNHQSQSQQVVPKKNGLHERRKREWINRSIKYYTTVRRIKPQSSVDTTQDMRLQSNSRAQGEASAATTEVSTEDAAMALERANHREFVELATRHYCALRKIKKGEFHHAERIYRRVIDKTIQDRTLQGHCDHAVLASSTLLLALLKQRTRDIKGTRQVFVNFFKIVGEDDLQHCVCSAKVLQAFALFEMKCGLGLKGLYLAKEAIRLDGSLWPVLEWKQFREVEEKKEQQRKRSAC